MKPGLYTVSGPGADEARPTEGTALVRAQTLALDSEGHATFYVRDQGDRATHRVERVGDVVLTHRLTEGA